MTVQGKPVALEGDLVACPQCKGNFPIIEGAKNMSSRGRGVALEGMKTACGAQLIGSQNLMWADHVFSHNEDSVSFTDKQPYIKEESLYQVRFHLTDDDGVPYGNTKFSLKLPDRVEQGVTDKDGYTQIFYSEMPGNAEIRLHIDENEANTWRW